MAPILPKKKVRKFIGVIHYYHNMCPRRWHKLAPLTKRMSIKRNFNWTHVKQYAFNKKKRIVAHDTLWTYPNFNETFKIYTNASVFQLGVVIRRKGKTIALYSRQLTWAKKRYILKEREPISVVETLKEFRTILLGHKLRIYTDNKNLTCKCFNTYRVLRLRLILEEYGPDI